MTAELRLVVMRHGATALTHRVVNGSGPHAADPPLTEEGYEQVAWARQRLADIGRPSECCSSPARRARQSAAAVGFAEPRVDDRIAEVDFGRWEGLSPTQIRQADPNAFARWWAQPEVAPPGGTSLADAAAGFRSLIDSLLAESRAVDVLVVGHATTVRVGTALALGLPLTESARVQAPPGVVAELRFWSDSGSCLDSLDWARP